MGSQKGDSVSLPSVPVDGFQPYISTSSPPPLPAPVRSDLPASLRAGERSFRETTVMSPARGTSERREPPRGSGGSRGRETPNLLVSSPHTAASGSWITHPTGYNDRWRPCRQDRPAGPGPHRGRHQPRLGGSPRGSSSKTRDLRPPGPGSRPLFRGNRPRVAAPRLRTGGWTWASETGSVVGSSRPPETSRAARRCAAGRRGRAPGRRQGRARARAGRGRAPAGARRPQGRGGRASRGPWRSGADFRLRPDERRRGPPEPRRPDRRGAHRGRGVRAAQPESQDRARCDRVEAVLKRESGQLTNACGAWPLARDPSAA